MSRTRETPSSDCDPRALEAAASDDSAEDAASSPPSGSGAPRLVPASEYCRLAGIRMSGEELDAWCDRNGHLAKALGRVGKEGDPGYDPRTAMHFRAIWMDAEKKWKEAQNADTNS
jgi:hypothetical protein